MSNRVQASAAPVSSADDGRGEGLCDGLWRVTRQLHAEAEKTGFVNEILRQQATLARYVVYLRNLLAVYDALERALQEGPAAANGIACHQVFRSPAIRADLTVLHGADWARDLPLLPAGAAYAERIAHCSRRDGGVGLAGHAYTRYLGDLNGGQVLARLLSKSLGVPEGGLAFYAFPGAMDPRALAVAYRTQLDAFGARTGDVSAIVEEAKASFEHSIALSLAVAAL